MSIVPASIRNKNPGAMYPGKSAKKFGSTSFETLISKDGKHKIATFPTPIHGAAAQFDLLERSYCGMPLEKAITKWCGAYYVSTYLKVLEENGGIKRTDMLTREKLHDPAIAIPIAKAMALQEAGREFPLDDEGWRTAHDMAFSGSVAPAFSPENDVPTPKRETRIAEKVDQAVKIAAGAAAVGGGGTVAVTKSSEPTKPADPPKPVIAPKETVSKAKETAKEIRENVEIAKDYWTWAKPTAVAAWENVHIVGPLVIVAGLAICWPKVKERLPWG